MGKSIRFLAALSLYVSFLVSCSPSAETVTADGNSAQKQASESVATNASQVAPAVRLFTESDLDADFAAWAQEEKEDHSQIKVDSILEKSIEAPSIRSRVKSSQGGLKANNFAQYFASQPFREIASKIARTPVIITYDPSKVADSPFSQKFPPNSSVVTVEKTGNANEWGLYCHSVNDDGTVGIGFPVKTYDAEGADL